ncbi:hypothetical protein [Sinorhizobium terangae]|uniref:hypothetical protein n=1 Tax=Sinorhizobium terangae TaxID=110322 RepID=UPI0024B13184|nr:hypothetical protein [Sinorhizobium terangae]WFU49809.1 hypothetical protein QA637_23625 [Sinorhizobium terangae]
MRHLFLITQVPSKFRELAAFLSLVAVFLVGAWVLLIAPNARAHDALPTAAQPHGGGLSPVLLLRLRLP